MPPRGGFGIKDRHKVKEEPSLEASQGKGAEFISGVIGMLFSGEPPGQDAY